MEDDVVVEHLRHEQHGEADANPREVGGELRDATLLCVGEQLLHRVGLNAQLAQVTEEP